MSDPWFTDYIGTWAALVERLDVAATLERWTPQEPALSGLTTCDDIQTPVGDTHNNDRLIGCLLRLASVHGANDPDAALVLAHLLAPGCAVLLRRFGPQRASAAELVFGELMVHIRSYNRGADASAHATNLLWRTDYGLRKQLADRRLEGRWVTDLALSFDASWEQPRSWSSVGGDLDSPEDDLHLIDVLLWAERTGVVDAAEVQLLIELASGDEAPGRDTARAAAARGVSVRTIERRRRTAVDALIGASTDFLAAA